MSNLISRIQQHTCTLLEKSQTVIVGLSGGPDSVFLFHALLPLHTSGQITLRAVHINHEWRTTAHHDEEFCRTLCTEHAIPFVVHYARNWQTAVPAHLTASSSPESHARHIRRAIFTHEATEHAPARVALAHHIDDQRETFFIRLIRGSSLSGLCGMLSQSEIYIRPLLNISKQEILSHLATQKLSFCHDETNESNAHLRNRIRQTLLPALLKTDSRALTTLDATMAQLKEEESYLAAQTKEHYDTLKTADGSLLLLPFLALHRALQTRLILMLCIEHQVPFTPSNALFDEMLRFLATAQRHQHTLSPYCRITKNKKSFSLVAIPSHST